MIHPLALAWDEEGLLWVLEQGASKPGSATTGGHDASLKIIQGKDAKGVGGKITVFADHLGRAGGFEFGTGGVYVGQGGDLLFLKRTGAGSFSTRTRIPFSGLLKLPPDGSIRDLIWGPDGWFYLTFGWNTGRSNPAAGGAILRFRPSDARAEIFAGGPEAPLGLDFDAAGRFFTASRSGLFHIHPGGVYGDSTHWQLFPYAYESLPAFFASSEPEATYSAATFYEGDLLIGDPASRAIHQFRLVSVGSTFRAEFAGDFLKAEQPCFHPVQTKIGPDGAVWIVDQGSNEKARVTAEPRETFRRGGIWRVSQIETSAKSPDPVPINLALLDSSDLLKLLEHPNVWQRRTARRLLVERRDLPGVNTLHEQNPLHGLLKKGATPLIRLEALWTLHAGNMMDDGALDTAQEDADSQVRAWAARLTGERGFPIGDAVKRLEVLGKDREPSVRLAVATAARQFVSSSLLADTPPMVPIREVITGPILSSLWFPASATNDPLEAFFYWMALEPIVAYDPIHPAEFMIDDGIEHMPFSGVILTKMMRRATDLGDPARLSRCILALSKFKVEHSSAILAAMKGLGKGDMARQVVPSPAAQAAIEKLGKLPSPELNQQAKRLLDLWRPDASRNNQP